MSDEEPEKGRRGYHHGNLRKALVDAALRLISRDGPNGFSFADAARAAGVSPAAPYRHFKDRDALIAEVAYQSQNALIPIKRRPAGRTRVAANPATIKRPPNQDKQPPTSP